MFFVNCSIVAFSAARRKGALLSPFRGGLGAEVILQCPGFLRPTRDRKEKNLQRQKKFLPFSLFFCKFVV